MKAKRAMRRSKAAPELVRFGTHAADIAANNYAPVAIKPRTKEPAGNDWQHYEFREADAARYPSHGIGLILGTVVAVDVDVRDPSAAEAIERAAVARFGKMPRRIGQAPKVAMLVRVAEPIKKITGASFRFPGDAEDAKPHRVEILAEGQQLVIAGEHPDTGRDYTWNGAGSPLTIAADQLPLVTEEALREFVADCDGIIAAAGGVLARKAAKGDAITAASFPARPEDLPAVKLGGWRLDAPTQSLIKTGVPEGQRSEALCSVYLACARKKMSPAEIASVCFDSAHGISEKPRKQGFAWLCADIARVLGEVAAKREERDTELFRRYIYVESQEAYWDRDERRLLARKALDDRFMAAFGDGSTPNGYGAHRHFMLNAKDSGGDIVRNVTYACGSPEIVEVEGQRCVNEWFAPSVETSGGDVSPYLEHAEVVIPDANIRETFFDWQAWVVQNPDKKPSYHWLIGSEEGVGKDTMLEPFLYAIGGPSASRTGVAYVTNETLTSGWGYHWKNRLVVVEELQEVAGADRRRLANTMKPFLAAPPHTIEVNEKFRHPSRIANRVCVAAFTNHGDAIGLDSGDRRWAAYWSYAPKMAPEAAKRLWEWYAAGGLQAVAGWLMRRDVSRFDPYARAPDTLWKNTLVASGKTETRTTLDACIENRTGVFAGDLVAADYAAAQLNKEASESGAASRRVISGQVSAALTVHGWRSLGRIDVKSRFEPGGRTRVTLFAHPESAARYAEMLERRGGTAEVLNAYREQGQRRGARP